MIIYKYSASNIKNIENIYKMFIIKFRYKNRCEVKKMRPKRI